MIQTTGSKCHLVDACVCVTSKKCPCMCPIHRLAFPILPELHRVYTSYLAYERSGQLYVQLAHLNGGTLVERKSGTIMPGISSVATASGITPFIGSVQRVFFVDLGQGLGLRYLGWERPTLQRLRKANNYVS